MFTSLIGRQSHILSEFDVLAGASWAEPNEIVGCPMSVVWYLWNSYTTSHVLY